MAENKAKAVLDTKLKQLLITRKRTENVIISNKDTAIKRQLEALKALTSEIEVARREVEAIKIEKSEDDDEVAQWNNQIEDEILIADEDIKRLEQWQNKEGKESIAREEQLKFEIKLQETKLQLQSEHEAKRAEKQAIQESKEVSVKLSELVVSKFDVSFADWDRLWGQFNESIERSSLASVAKFSYLKELLSYKVRRDVESLPFTSEGYNRARAILKEKYGKESEVVKAYSKKILDLPVITSNNPKKIGEFSEKLTYCVQCLQTLNKFHMFRQRS